MPTDTPPGGDTNNLEERRTIALERLAQSLQDEERTPRRVYAVWPDGPVGKGYEPVDVAFHRWLEDPEVPEEDRRILKDLYSEMIELATHRTEPYFGFAIFLFEDDNGAEIFPLPAVLATTPLEHAG